MRKRILLVVSLVVLCWIDGIYAQNEQSIYGVYSSHTLRQHFMSEMGMTEDSYYEWCDSHMGTLSAHWTNFSLLFVWDKIEPTLGGGYNWNVAPCNSDTILTNVYEPPNDINVIAVITPGLGASARNPLTYPTEWQNFLKALAERYDGDGIDDADTNIHLKYFQLCNEIQDWQEFTFKAPANYASIANTLLTGIRTHIPEAKLFAVGCFSNLTAGGNIDPNFKNILDACQKANTDLYAVDIHHWPWMGKDSLQSWKMENLAKMRAYLNSIDYNNTEIWCQHAAYTGTPTKGFYISEIDQARWLVKSFNYNRLNGMNRFLWHQLLDQYNFSNEQSSPFNAMGLIGDGYGNGETIDRRNTTRIAYWAYKTMVEKTDNPTASLLGTVSGLHNNSTIYAYRWKNNQDNSNFYIIWSESGTQQMKLKIDTPGAHITNLITDRYGTIQEEYDVQAVNGTITFNAGADPLLVKEISGVTAIHNENNNVPEKFVLYQNYPNPFNPTTNIEYRIQNKEYVSLKVYDVLGREVATLVNGELNAGEHLVVFSAKYLSSGIYFYRLTAGTFSQTKLMEVIK